MRAFTLDSFETPPGLRDDLAMPAVGATELLVRVHASSINPVDGFAAAGMMKEMVQYRFPVILGRDFAGVVEEVGSAVGRYHAGDEVYGFLGAANPDVHDGSWVDYLAVSEEISVSRKPESADFAAAGAAPLAAITALAALDALELAEGASVLVVGANGGTGSFFVQLAAATGANVVAVALPEDGDYLRGLGASEVIDRNADVSAEVHERFPGGADAVLDLASRAPDSSSLKEGGRLASPLGAAGEGPGRVNLMASPTTSNLERLAQLIDAGSLRVPIQHSYPLDEAGSSLEAFATTHKQGKVAIAIA